MVWAINLGGRWARRALAFLGLGVAAGLLAGCASEARSTAMVAPVSAATIVNAGNPLQGGIVLGVVGGGELTNPLWTSQVSSANYRQALDTSLALTTLRAPAGAQPGPGVYVLDATLEEIDQPQLAVNFTVTVTALYQLRNPAGALVYNERITSPYTARIADSLVRAERLRLANEGAVKANIDVFLQRLVAASNANPAQFSGG